MWIVVHSGLVPRLFSVLKSAVGCAEDEWFSRSLSRQLIAWVVGFVQSWVQISPLIVMYNNTGSPTVVQILARFVIIEKLTSDWLID